MTPEKRAQDVTALLMKTLPGTSISLVMADRDQAFALIASAIREAENAALERAAGKFDAFADHAENFGFAAAKSRTGRDKARAATRAYRQAASKARNLKSKGTEG